MSVSVADLVLDRVGGAPDEFAPPETAPLVDTVALLLESRLTRTLPGQGEAYLRRLIAVLDMPLSRILVTGLRTYQEFLRFAATRNGGAARSGEVEVLDYEVMSRWEIAPRYSGTRIEGPRLLVGLTLGMDIGTVVIHKGRFTGLRAGAIRCDAVLELKEAPSEVAKLPPRLIEIPGGRLDFGEGWPIRPFERA